MGATNKPTRDGNSLKENAEIDDNYDSEEDAKADNIGCQEIRDEVENDDYIEEGIIQQEELLTVVYEVLEARKLTETRPLPVLVKGREVDLVKLSVQVRALGGYDRVTMWSSISKSIGFGPEGGPLLKLVYAKYLKALENRRLIAGQVGLSSDTSALKIKETTPNIESHEHNLEPVSKMNSSKSQESSPNVRRVSSTNEEEKPSVSTPYAQPQAPCPAPCAMPPPPHDGIMSSESSSSLASLLEWVKRLASNPGDPKKGHGSRVSRGNEALVEKYVTLSHKVRAVLCKHAEHVVMNPRSESPVQQHSKKRGATGRGKEVQEMSSAKKSRQTSS